VQTFLPYPDLRASSAALDDRRLGKQRVETFQILRALTWPAYAWKNHPAVKMWRGFVPGLVAYGLENCAEWTRRGYADTVAEQLLGWGSPSSYDLPPWFGLDALHRSHQSSLLRKDAAYYGLLFPGVPDDLPYFWPTPVFPRWPVRRGPEPVGLAAALGLLGYSAPLPGQAEAVAEVVAGHDCVLTLPPGGGATTTGVLAGLCTPGRTLWITPAEGSLAPPPGVDPRAVRRSLPPPPKPQKAASINRKPPASTAKSPGPEDLSAMRAEHAPSDWVFRRPDEPLDGAVGLVVIDGAERLGTLSRPVDAPVLRLAQS
jgi:hypothetical protein